MTRGALVALSMALAQGIGAGPKAWPHRPPAPVAVVLVTVDTLRADAVSLDGRAPGPTPFLESLAAEGTVFTRAYSTSSWTPPAMASLFTSLYPSAHGIVSGFYEDGKVIRQPTLAQPLLTLAEAFKRAGYVTVGVPANRHLSGALGFGQGFDHYPADAPFLDAPQVNDQVIEQLRAAFGPDWRVAWKRRRVFLWIHYFDPHDPYTAREPWIGRYVPEYAKRRPELPSTLFMTELRARHPRPSEEDAAPLRQLYRSEVSYFDAWFQRLSETLGLAEPDVLTVLTSDHGEEFGEHGGLGHALTLHEELVRVPMLIRWPAGLPGGRRLDHPVSLLDIYPTLADLLNLGQPPVVHGVSLLPALRGGGAPAERHLYFEVEPPYSEYPALTAVREGRWKLSRPSALPGPLRLFDLEADPGERDDVSSRHPEVLRRLQGGMTAWLRSLPPAPPRSWPATDDEELKERLRALGYIKQ